MDVWYIHKKAQQSYYPAISLKFQIVFNSKLLLLLLWLLLFLLLAHKCERIIITRLIYAHGNRRLLDAAWVVCHNTNTSTSTSAPTAMQRDSPHIYTHTHTPSAIWLAADSVARFGASQLDDMSVGPRSPSRCPQAITANCLQTYKICMCMCVCERM